MEKGLKRKEEEKKKKEEGGTQKIEEKKIEYTSDLIIKKLKEIVENRFHSIIFSLINYIFFIQSQKNIKFKTIC